MTEDKKDQETQETGSKPISRREFGVLVMGAGLAATVYAKSAADLDVVETDVTIKMPDGTCDAAFIHPRKSRTAGAGDSFPYARSHYVYINAAARQALGRETGWVITARRPSDYAPALGDIICTGRDRARHIRFDRLPARPFPSHCDIVVAISAAGGLSVVGGNVDHAVTMKHVPVSSDGHLAGRNGTPIDTRYDWFVVDPIFDAWVQHGCRPIIHQPHRHI